MGANGVMGSRECRAHSSYHLERMCSAKETRWRLGSEGGDGGLAREAQEPGFPPLEPIPALTLPSPHATWLPFRAVNINLAVGGFSTIVSLGRSALHFYLHLVCRGGDDFVSLP